MLDDNVKGGPSTPWSRLKDPIQILSTPSRRRRRAPDRPGRASERSPWAGGGVEVAFATVAIVCGVVGAIWLWVAERSFPLSLYALCVLVIYVGIGLGDVATGTSKVRRFLAFTLFPVVGTLILIGTYRLWEMWWLAALLGFFGGFVVWAVLAGWLFPDILADGGTGTGAR
jgi:hypothetical protein